MPGSAPGEYQGGLHPGAVPPEALSGSSFLRRQFCDACDTACVLMQGGEQRRKLQSRYEGFLLVKRVQGGPYATGYFRPPAGEDPSRPLIHSQCRAAPYERRHSCDDVIDSVRRELTRVPIPHGSNSVPHVTVCHPGEYHPGWEKLVNVHLDTHPPALLNNNLPERKLRKRGVGSAAHLRLCRKKSRSQDNLSGRRARVHSEGHKAGAPPLNNTVTPSRLNGPLSKSEGSIHNVTTRSKSPLEGAPLKPEELSKLPKKILNRVTGEMGHIVFYLERWREEYVVLAPTAVAIKGTDGSLETLVPYCHLEDVHSVASCNMGGQHHCLLLLTGKETIMLQASTAYVRDQWFYTILWKKNSYKFRNLLKTATRSEVLLKELKNLVDLSLLTPLHDSSVFQVPLELASSILMRNEATLTREMREEIIVILSPLLENSKPSPEICSFFSGHCSDSPRSRIVIDMFTPVVSRILKHNMDFGKYPHVKKFVQDYIQALNSQNDGKRLVHQFVHEMHGPSCNCPHLRVLSNLVVVCISAICNLLQKEIDVNDVSDMDYEGHLQCYISVLNLICDYDDWRPYMAQLLQPVPFPESALVEEGFMEQMLPIVRKIGADPRCEVHQMVLSGREDKEGGWLHFVSPSSLAASSDKGDTWITLLEVLISCCYRRKKLLKIVLKSLGACMLLALRDNATAQEILCLMLEWQLVESDDQCVQMIATLQCTAAGKRKYQALCQRQNNLRELQEKGGPRKLTLPSRSTDADVIRFLSSGPFGNLEVLSLACTRVTSACAEQLIKLPSLKYLNLWSTQFGDSGLQEICEHLPNLQVLNLCETSVTDKGLISLISLKNLRVLNLNSTGLSVQTYDLLKASLPVLQEVDIKYTDAW